MPYDPEFYAGRRQDTDLDHHNRCIEICRLFDSNHQHQSAKDNREKAEQLKYTVGVRQGCRINSNKLELGNDLGRVLPMVLVKDEFVSQCVPAIEAGSLMPKSPSKLMKYRSNRKQRGRTESVLHH